MKKAAKSKGILPKVDPYLEGLFAKLVDRMAQLEKKIDTLLAQAHKQTAGASAPSASHGQAVEKPRRDRTLYEAICAACSKVCEVPFKPVEGRPVYCKECWAERKNGGAGKTPHGMPVLTPVALAPKPVSKLSDPVPAPKKSKPSKKSKKKK